MSKCSKCGSYDIDVTTDRKFDLECQECGHKFRARKTKKESAKKTAERTADVLGFYAMIEGRK